MEDLLIALADRRSFPDTRFFVARGIVGETWSTGSVGPALFPDSVLTLPVKEPGREMEGEIVDRKKRTTIDETELDMAVGFIRLCDCHFIPACFVMHLAAPTKQDHLGFFHRHSQKRTIQTVKVLRFEFVSPIKPLK